MRIWVCIVCFFIPSVWGQARYNVGVHSGVNFASASQSQDVNTSSRVGWIAGGLFEIVPQNSMVSIQTEIHYIQKGMDFDSAGSAIHWQFNYIEIPLLIRTAYRHEGFRPFAFIGPKVGFLLHSQAAIRLPDRHENVDLSDVTESVEFALDGGFGLQYTRDTRITYFAQLRFSVGLKDIDKSGARWLSRDTQLTAGVKFAVD